jgi:hypothetical protein
MEIGNSELLYSIIDSLSDEEFQELLDTLSISDDKVEEVKQEKEEVVEQPVEEKIDLEACKKALQERVVRTQKLKQIQEKLEAARKTTTTGEKRKQIQEKLEAARKQNKVAESKKTNSTEELLRKKIMEKLEVSRKKKAIQERITNLKEKK